MASVAVAAATNTRVGLYRRRHLRGKLRQVFVSCRLHSMIRTVGDQKVTFISLLAGDGNGGNTSI